MSDEKKSGAQLRTDWAATAREMVKYPMTSGLLALGFAAAHIPITLITHDNFYAAMGVAWGGLGAFELHNFMRTSRKTKPPSPTPGG